VRELSSHCLVSQVLALEIPVTVRTGPVGRMGDKLEAAVAQTLLTSGVAVESLYRARSGAFRPSILFSEVAHKP